MEFGCVCLVPLFFVITNLHSSSYWHHHCILIWLTCSSFSTGAWMFDYELLSTIFNQSFSQNTFV